MIWKFTILYNGVETEIDEPEQWDSIDKTIQRDKDTHGIVFNFSTNGLDFSGDAYWLIKEEYLLNGVDGDVGLRIEWLCNDCDGYQLFYLGKIDFGKYVETCGNYCKVSVGLEKSDVEVLITNRMDTAVDLTCAVAYDNTTPLAEYTGLGHNMLIPAKSLLRQAAANSTPIDGDTGYDIVKDADFDPFTAQRAQEGYLLPKFNNTSITEIEDFTPSYQLDYRTDFDPVPILEIKPLGIDSGVNSYEVSLRFKGAVHVLASAFPSSSGPASASVNVYFDAALYYGPGKTAAFAPARIVTYEVFLPSDTNSDTTTPFDFSWTGSVNMDTHEKMWAVIKTRVVTATPSVRSPLRSLKVLWDDASFFRVKNFSVTMPTPAKVYMVHEATSRVVENITNGQYRFKSAHYGRIDSEPYSFPTNGCGGLRALTNGLQLRRAVLQDNTPAKVFTSLKDIFKSLNAIDAVGMGIEGENVIFEPLKYFYSDDIIFVCDGVDQIQTKVRSEVIYNQFNVGYDKFETESTNGLDSIHTKRQYRLQIKNTDQKIEKFSTFIADGYAIEATRRKYGSTEDWRYDQNIFILCCRQGVRGSFLFSSFVSNSDFIAGLNPGDKLVVSGSQFNNGTYTVDFTSDFGGNGNYAVYFIEPVIQENDITIGIQGARVPVYAVEQGNIAGAENLFDPPTVINYAISPVRMALRWFAWVMQGLKRGGNLTFSSGEGNYVAKGKLTTGCAPEFSAVAENNQIDLETFADVSDSVSFTEPEFDAFTFPMGLNEFVEISAHKYGKIQYRRFETDEWKYGWVDSIKYSPNHGSADFNLITCKKND